MSGRDHLSSTSAQSSPRSSWFEGKSVRLLGIQKNGTDLSKSERRLKHLIESGQLQVNYKVIDVKLPDGTEIKERLAKDMRIVGQGL
jgi:RNA-binding protein YlmH